LAQQVGGQVEEGIRVHRGGLSVLAGASGTASRIGAPL
jgi:hypothetical protein